MKTIVTICTIFIALYICSVPADVALAIEGYEYVTIIDFPIPASADVSSDKPLTLEDAIKIIYALSVSIAALLAVVKIIYAGVQYMLSDVVTTKGKAVADIQGALFGLLIVLSAAFILQQVNPQLTNVEVLKEVSNFKGSQAANKAALQRPAKNQTPSGDTDIGVQAPLPKDQSTTYSYTQFAIKCAWNLGGIQIKKDKDGKERYHCIR